MAAGLDVGGIYPPASCSRATRDERDAGSASSSPTPSRSWVVGGTTHDREPTSSPPQSSRMSSISSVIGEPSRFGGDRRLQRPGRIDGPRPNLGHSEAASRIPRERVAVVVRRDRDQPRRPRRPARSGDRVDERGADATFLLERIERHHLDRVTVEPVADVAEPPVVVVDRNERGQLEEPEHLAPHDHRLPRPARREQPTGSVSLVVAARSHDHPGSIAPRTTFRRRHRATTVSPRAGPCPRPGRPCAMRSPARSAPGRSRTGRPSRHPSRSPPRATG